MRRHLLGPGVVSQCIRLRALLPLTHRVKPDKALLWLSRHVCTGQKRHLRFGKLCWVGRATPSVEGSGGLHGGAEPGCGLGG